MFKCNDCKAEFDEPKIVFETHGFSSPPYERWAVCPRCKNNNFDEYKEGEDE